MAHRDGIDYKEHYILQPIAPADKAAKRYIKLNQQKNKVAIIRDEKTRDPKTSFVYENILDVCYISIKTSLIDHTELPNEDSGKINIIDCSASEMTVNLGSPTVNGFHIKYYSDGCFNLHILFNGRTIVDVLRGTSVHLVWIANKWVIL